MSVITKQDTGNQTAVLNLKIEKDDYIKKFQSELKTYSKKATLKGFRPGKAPISLIKKMYGKQLLFDTINQKVQSELYAYINENNLDILGQPLPSDETPLDFDINDLGDFDFKYELGIAPEFELEGADTSNTYDYTLVEPTEDQIQKEVSQIRKQLGETTNPDDIEDKDVVTFKAVELEGDAPKEGGVEKEVVYSIDEISNAKLKKSILKLKKGDSIKEDIYKFNDKDQDWVNKYVLGLEGEEEVNATFEFTVEKVVRVIEAELNEDLFKKLDEEGSINSKEELEAKIKSNISNYYKGHSDQLFFKDVREKLVESNDMELPTEFLKKWVDASNPEMSMEEIEKDFDGFSKELKWSLIRNKLVKANDIEVKQEELVEAFKNQIRQYFGGQGDEAMITQTAISLMQDQKQVEQQHQQILTSKVVDALKGSVTLNEKTITPDELDELLKN